MFEETEQAKKVKNLFLQNDFQIWKKIWPHIQKVFFLFATFLIATFLISKLWLKRSVINNAIYDVIKRRNQTIERRVCLVYCLCVVIKRMKKNEKLYNSRNGGKWYLGGSSCYNLVWWKILRYSIRSWKNVWENVLGPKKYFRKYLNIKNQHTFNIKHPS